MLTPSSEREAYHSILSSEYDTAKERSGQKKKPQKTPKPAEGFPAAAGGRPDECSDFAQPSEEPVGRGRGPGGAGEKMIGRSS